MACSGNGGWAGNETLQTLYENDEVKKRVRKFYASTLVAAVTTKSKELVLNYKNHISFQLYHQFPFGTWGEVKVSTFLKMIPKNTEGPLQGAAHPVTLYLDAIDIANSTIETGIFM